MGIYTHIGLHDQTTAIERLPAPPSGNLLGNNGITIKKVNGSKPKFTSPISDLGQLDSVWGRMPGDIKTQIFSLINMAVKSK